MARIAIKDLPKNHRIEHDELRRIRGGTLPYMATTLTNLVISSYSPSPGSSGETPLEEITFNFNEIHWSYTESGSSSSGSDD